MFVGYWVGGIGCDPAGWRYFFGECVGSWEKRSAVYLWRRAFWALCVLACVRESATAQIIQGSIYEVESGKGVSGAEVRLYDNYQRVVGIVWSGGAGTFELRVPTVGMYRLGISALGHAPTNTGEFHVAASDTLTMEFHVPYAPIVMDSISVSVYNEARTGYERRRNLSYGTRLGPEDLAERGEMTLNEFVALRAPWLGWHNSYEGLYTYRANSKGWRCSPMIFIDLKYLRTAKGIVPELDRWLDPDDVRAVEVYPDGSVLPSPFWGLARAELFGRAPCGLIAVWTSASF